MGFACTSRDEQADGQSQSCLTDAQELQALDEANNHWTAADQILAIGDIDGPLDTNGDGTIDVPAYPDLLVKKGYLLWLYFDSDSFYLDASRAPVLIGEGSRSAYDLAAPGDRTGNGHPDLIARHKSSGEQRLYEGTGNSGEGLSTGPTSPGLGTGPAGIRAGLGDVGPASAPRPTSRRLLKISGSGPGSVESGPIL
ncbi:hypothetical protein ACIA74_44890 [Streptomyces sp. NPDC051658]|uniref:hypothetical protein n=1 Tax=Streptomyces sp. NPDC051658 TaxID=3365667 RepID=UPI00379D78AA